jgi:hypothetical protein
MRIAVVLLGLLIGLLLVWQSATIGIFNETPTIDATTAVAGGAGLAMALLWLLASALVIPLPMVSVLLFGLTIPPGLIVPTGEFADLRFHGIVAVVLTAMSLIGWHEKRELDREREEDLQRQRNQFLHMVMYQHHQAQRQRNENHRRATGGVFCTTCGVQAEISKRFCGDCGTPLRQLASAAA